MSDKSKSVILLISKSFGLIINMVAIMIISRFLTVNEYGDYRQIMTIVGILISVFSLGLPSSVLYFLSGNEKNKYISNIIFYIFVLSGIFLILSYPLMSMFNSIFVTNLFTEEYFMILIIILFSFMVSIIENLFISYNKFIQIIIVTIIPNLIFMVVIIYSYFFDGDLSIILISLAAREFLKILVLIHFVSNEKVDLAEINSSRMKEIIYFGTPIGLSTIIGSLNTSMDKLVVGRFMDNEAFAIISNGSYEIPVLGLIGLSLFNVLLPNLKNKLNYKKKQEVLDLWNRAGKVMITVVVPISIGTIFFANEIIILLFSDKYESAVILFQIYQINALSRIYIYGTFFIAAGRSKIYTLNSIIHLTTNLVLNLLLIGPFGLIGVAAATVISNLIQIFIQNLQISNMVGCKSRDLFPLKSFLKSNIISIGLFLLTYSIYINLFGFSIFVGLFIMSISILIAMLILNFTITREILDYVLSFYRRIKSKN